jgi:hypothetical protein
MSRKDGSSKYRIIFAVRYPKNFRYQANSVSPNVGTWLVSDKMFYYCSASLNLSEFNTTAAIFQNEATLASADVGRDLFF